MQHQATRLLLAGLVVAALVPSVASLRLHTSLARRLPTARPRPPLVFVHGSFHSSWCWDAHWSGHFSALGHDCYSVSLRGTAASPDDSGARAIRVATHVGDLQRVLADVAAADGGRKPVLVGHSFGGLLVLKLLEAVAAEDVAGVALLCSVPPSGNGPMTQRFLRTRPLASLKIVLALVAKKACAWEGLARETFFTGAEISDADVRAAMARFAADSAVGLDLADVVANLPADAAGPGGKAWLAGASPPRLVVGAADDYLVDRQGVEETAAFLGTEAVSLPATPHDLMLTEAWRNGARCLETWLEGV